MGKPGRSNRQLDKINERLRDRDREGLKQDIEGSFMDDARHHVIECSACGRELCDIWVYRPTIKLRSTIVAKCGHCGDKSFKVDVRGQFSVGHTEESSISDMQTDGLVNSGDAISQNVTIETQPKE